MLFRLRVSPAVYEHPRVSDELCNELPGSRSGHVNEEVSIRVSESYKHTGERNIRHKRLASQGEVRDSAVTSHGKIIAERDAASPRCRLLQGRARQKNHCESQKCSSRFQQLSTGDFITGGAVRTVK